jgi:hypothetical protein
MSQQFNYLHTNYSFTLTKYPMKNIFFLTLVSLFFLGNVSAVNLEIGFNDANGTNLNATSTTGDATGAWNFGGASTQTAGSNTSGSLNIGYTTNYKGLFNNGSGVPQIDAGDVTRRFSLDQAISEGTYTFTVVLDTWQLSDSQTPDMGIHFGLENDVNNNFARVALKAGSGNFAQAYSQGSGSVVGAFGGTTSGIGLNNSWNFNSSNDSKDLTLQINGDLSTGAWSARSSLGVNNDGDSTDSLTWTELSSGTGLTSITGFQMKTMNGGGVWGTDASGGSTGNWVAVDNISLVTVVPEPSTYALLIGFASFLFVAIRKRK